MKQLIKKSLQPGNTDIALLVVRISIAALMLTHGLPKLAGLLSGAPVEFPGILGMSPALSLSLAVFAEVACSIFILAGLGTRLATIPLIVTMAIAAFHVHAADPFAVKEMAILYLLAFSALLISGGGRYSLDNAIARRTGNVPPGAARIIAE